MRIPTLIYPKTNQPATLLDLIKAAEEYQKKYGREPTLDQVITYIECEG